MLVDRLKNLLSTDCINLAIIGSCCLENENKGVCSKRNCCLEVEVIIFILVKIMEIKKQYLKIILNIFKFVSFIIFSFFFLTKNY